MKRLTLFAALLLTALLATACSRELTEETALEKLSSLSEFRAPFFAPMRIGEMVLTNEKAESADQFIRDTYGPLLDAGVLDVTVTDRSSWRAVILIELTDKGKAMCDNRRGNDHQAYVQVCYMVPCEIRGMLAVTPDKVVECTYAFAERNITPFGTFLGYTDGTQHIDTRTFVRSGSSWQVQ